MSRPILFHGPAAPRAKVVRLALGLKRLALGSVETPVEGRLVREDAAAITLRRETAEPGPGAVHFPRAGQVMERV